MPIKVPNDLPAVETLTKENVFVMTDTRAMTQDIRPLQILILNLMPTKIDTETQLTRLLGNTPLQVELELLQTSTHKSHVTSEEHMLAFYKTFDQVKDNYYDGMIITGAPIELMDFEEVEYWDELCDIMGLIDLPKQEVLDSDIENLIAERQAARKARNFARADEIRDMLKGMGIELMDTKEGVKWSRK